MRDIKIQTVTVREIKKIVETERQITGSERTQRGGPDCHMTELLGSLTLKPHDLLSALSQGIVGKTKRGTFLFPHFQLRFKPVYITLSV